MPYIGKAPSSGIRSRFIYTATASQTTFTGADGNGKTLGYTDGEYVDVYLNGVLLDPADYTATSKTSVVLDSGATVSDIVEIVVYDTFSVFNGTFTGDLTVDGDTLFVDSTNNRVGIGTTSPEDSLHVKSGKIRIENAIVSNNDSTISYDNADFVVDVDSNNVRGSSNFIVKMDTVEACRVDDTRNFLVKNTTGSSSDVGHILAPTGAAFHVRDGGIPLILDRLTSDGEILRIRKQGATVGSISNVSTNLKVNGVGALELSEN